MSSNRFELFDIKPKEKVFVHHLRLQEVNKELLENRICDDVWEMDHLFRGPHHVRRWEIRYDRGHCCVRNGEKGGERRERGVERRGG